MNNDETVSRMKYFGVGQDVIDRFFVRLDPRPAGPDDHSGQEQPNMVCEGSAAYDLRNLSYTVDDLELLPDEVHAELIHGEIFFMSTPTRTHQKIIGDLHVDIANFIRSHKGKCEVFESNYGVFLHKDEHTYLLPDLMVICDPDKLREKGCLGAPDWVVEVLSPSTRNRDMGIKMSLYRKAGVKEYWIIDPGKRIVVTFWFDGDSTKEASEIYLFGEPVPCRLLQGLTVTIG